MRQRDDAIDVVETVETAHPIEIIGDVARHRGRAIDRRNHADEIARADAASATVEAHEMTAFRLGQHAAFLNIDGELMLVFGGQHGEVLEMHVLALRNVLRRNANHLPVFQDFLTFRNVANGNLVPTSDQFSGLDPFKADRIASANRNARHRNIIRRMQQNYRRNRCSNGIIHVSDLTPKSPRLITRWVHYPSNAAWIGPDAFASLPAPEADPSPQALRRSPRARPEPEPMYRYPRSAF